MNGKLLRRKGERGIINAVERCMNELEEWKKSKRLNRRLRFEQSVRMLVKSIPEEWQDTRFLDDLYEVCLDLLERKGMPFARKTSGGKSQSA